MPAVFPEERSSYVALSSREREAISNFSDVPEVCPEVCQEVWLTSLTDRSMTVSVLRPRKSNFTRPTFSISSMENCVTTSPLLPRDRGTYSVRGSFDITMPAACVDACLVSPSSAVAYSISSFILTSVLINSFSFGSDLRASSMLTFGPSGISFATLSTSE